MPRIYPPCKGCTKKLVNDNGGKLCNENNCQEYAVYREKFQKQTQARNEHVATQFGIRKVQYNGLTKSRR